MNKIPEFDKFNETIVAAGFGQMGINNFALGGATPQTGYSMTPIAGVVESCSNHVAQEADTYEKNDNDNHTAESYIKEAKKHINESLDKAYESYSATNEGEVNEAMVQIKGKAKPSGAKVLAKIIVGEFNDQKAISSRSVKPWEDESAELIMNSTS